MVSIIFNTNKLQLPQPPHVLRLGNLLTITWDSISEIEDGRDRHIWRRRPEFAYQKEKTQTELLAQIRGS